MQIVKRPDDLHTFTVLPGRWAAGRTLAWITSYRRCARDYERLPAHHETMILWAMSTLMTRRLHSAPTEVVKQALSLPFNLPGLTSGRFADLGPVRPACRGA